MFSFPTWMRCFLLFVSIFAHLQFEVFLIQNVVLLQEMELQ